VFIKKENGRNNVSFKQKSPFTPRSRRKVVFHIFLSLRATISTEGGIGRSRQIANKHINQRAQATIAKA